MKKWLSDDRVLSALRLHSRMVASAVLALVIAGAAASAQDTARLADGDAAAAASSAIWVAAWQGSPTASQLPEVSSCPAAAGLGNQTVRNIIYPSAGGNQVRVRISNAGGSTPLRVGAVSIGLSSGKGAAVKGTPYPLLFGGKASTVISAQGEALSDPLTLKVAALKTMAVSIYLPDQTGPATEHYSASQTNYLAVGNQTPDVDGSSFTRSVSCWLFLSGVDVQASTNVRGTLVTLGDSITDGYLSTNNDNYRYPDGLARRFSALTGTTLAVSNAGLSGNALLANQTQIVFGVPAPARLARDVLTQPGVRAIILLEGINDIGANGASAADLIEADQQIVAQAHAAGLKIYGGTLLPFGGSNAGYHGSYGTASGEEQRQALNKWILTGNGFDGTIDFDKALRDPQDPQRLLPLYDSGDHLHPNSDGYLRMSNLVNVPRIIRESVAPQ